MSDAQQVRRAVERFQRGRRWEHSAFPTSSGGLLHTPYPRLGAGQPRTAGGGGDITIGQAPIGEILRAGVHGHLSPGGEPVVWTNVLDRLGFASATFPNVELRLPHTAVYGIEGDLSWTDGFLGGGRVSLLLNGVGIPGLSPIRAGGTVANAVGQTFTLAQEFVANEGDRLMVMMDHDGDAHHDLHGVIEVATKEPLRVVVRPTAPAFAAGDVATAVEGGPIGSLQAPTNAEPGDLLIGIGVAVTIAMGGGTRHVTFPTGWTILDFHQWNNGNCGASGKAFTYRVGWKMATAGDLSGPMGFQAPAFADGCGITQGSRSRAYVARFAGMTVTGADSPVHDAGGDTSNFGVASGGLRLIPWGAAPFDPNAGIGTSAGHLAVTSSPTSWNKADNYQAVAGIIFASGGSVSLTATSTQPHQSRRSFLPIRVS